MAIHDESQVRKPHLLSGLLRSWRRIVSRAGIATLVLTVVVAAVAVFTLCACKNMH